jgi:hypothetical protein
MQNFIGRENNENPNELLSYIRGENENMPRLNRGKQREILLLVNLGLKTYEIQYIMHLKNKKKLGQKWRR